MKNKIVVNGDDVRLVTCDDNIIVSLSDKLDIYDVIKINISIKNSTKIEFEFKSEDESKYDLAIELEDNVDAEIFELKENENIKIQEKFYIKSNCNLIIDKFYDCGFVRELDLVYLNGLDSSVNYSLKTIGKGIQKFDMMVYHNFNNTISKIENKGVSIGNGNITFNTTGIVYKGIKNCKVDQNNKIVNMNDETNVIKPILIIDEQDVEANHSAFIGKFNEEEIFYMTSRGIPENEAIKLLLKGFLKDDNIDSDKKINEYWG